MKRTKSIRDNLLAICELHTAVTVGSAQAVRELLQAGAAVHETDSLGSTALHRAAWQADVAKVVILLAHGADAGALRADGAVPADLAERRVAGDGPAPPMGLSEEPDTAGNAERVARILRQDLSGKAFVVPLAGISRDAGGGVSVACRCMEGMELVSLNVDTMSEQSVTFQEAVAQGLAVSPRHLRLCLPSGEPVTGSNHKWLLERLCSILPPVASLGLEMPATPADASRWEELVEEETASFFLRRDPSRSALSPGAGPTPRKCRASSKDSDEGEPMDMLPSMASVSTIASESDD